MKLELSIYELGQALKKLDKNYNLEMYTIIKLSAGWFTVSGRANVEAVPQQLVLSGANKSNNIIDIRLRDDNEEGKVVKITGAKGEKFKIDISSTRYKEIIKGNINNDEIKVDNSESKIRISDEIMFKVNASEESIINLISKKH